MNLSRRSLLTGLIAAPAVIAADRLMPVRLWVPTIYGDAVHDDWEGLTALMNDKPVRILANIYPTPGAPELGFTSVKNKYSLSRPLVLAAADTPLRRDVFINDTFTSRPEFEGEALIIGRRQTILSSDETYPTNLTQGGAALLGCTAYFENPIF